MNESPSSWVVVNDAPEALDLKRALAEVSSERREYALRYRFERDQRLSVAAYLLLKGVLEREYGLKGNPRLERGANGKPYLAEHPEIHFNFSHCPKAVACIVSDRPVGIDIEEIRPVDWKVARRVLSETELAEVRADAEPNVAFVRYWTRKEALVKLTGAGMDEARLPDLLHQASGCRFQTTVNRARAYVMTTATREDDTMWA